jgi:hypothetical protein
MIQLEKLSLSRFEANLATRTFSQAFPRLRDLTLNSFDGDDAALARAIRSVSETLEFFELQERIYRDGVRYDETIAAIGTLRELRRLRLSDCPGLPHAMLEPLLIGSPPTQPPLCPKVRFVLIRLDEPSPEFMQRVRESIRLRFPNGDIDVHG